MAPVRLLRMCETPLEEFGAGVARSPGRFMGRLGLGTSRLIDFWFFLRRAHPRTTVKETAPSPLVDVRLGRVAMAICCGRFPPARWARRRRGLTIRPASWAGPDPAARRIALRQPTSPGACGMNRLLREWTFFRFSRTRAESTSWSPHPGSRHHSSRRPRNRKFLAAPGWRRPRAPSKALALDSSELPPRPRYPINFELYPGSCGADGGCIDGLDRGHDLARIFVPWARFARSHGPAPMREWLARE